MRTFGHLIRSLKILESVYGAGSLQRVGPYHLWLRGEKFANDTPVADIECNRDDVPVNLREELYSMGWVFLRPPGFDNKGFWQATMLTPGEN